jgi:hypothetical protein
VVGRLFASQPTDVSCMYVSMYARLAFFNQNYYILIFKNTTKCRGEFFLECLKFVFAFHQSGLYPHEEISCSRKSNIFYLTYLAMSCIAHTQLDESSIFDWHGLLDVRDL